MERQAVTQDLTIDDFELDPEGNILGFPYLRPSWTNEKKFIVKCVRCGSIKDYYISSARVQTILNEDKEPYCKACSMVKTWEDKTA